MDRLAGKIAIITGASQGMGEAHARTFVRDGAKVVMTDLNAGRGRTIAADLGNTAHFVEHDVASKAGLDKVVAETEQRFGPANILVNNAGVIGPVKGLLDSDEQDFLAVCPVN